MPENCPVSPGRHDYQAPEQTKNSKRRQARILKGFTYPFQTNSSEDSLTSVFLPNQRFTKVAKMLTQGETGIFSGTENRSKRDQLECLWISGEGRWPLGEVTFVTGFNQGQTREADQRPRLWLPTLHPHGGLSQTQPLSFLQGLKAGPNTPSQKIGKGSWDQ